VGLNVYDYGVVPTPVLAFLIKKSGTPGVMVTASHNPPEWNGLQFMEEDSHIFGPEEENMTKGKIDNESKALRFCEWNQFGQVLLQDNGIDTYVKEIVKSKQMGNRKLKVVLDYGNGTAWTVLPKICRALWIPMCRS